MRLKIKIAAWLLIIGVAFIELAEVLERLGIQSKMIHPMRHPPEWAKDGINNLWWLKYNSDQFLMCSVFVVMAIIAHMVSRRLWIISLIFLSYHIVDWFMLWYDYKQSHVMYWLLIADIIAAVIVLVRVKDKPKVKSLI